jgi:hypothetical protein
MKGVFTLSILFLLLFVSFRPQAQAQSKTEIRGFLLDKDNEEPILFTNVYLKGTNYGVSTDINGFFSIKNMPPGTYVLKVSSVGYDSLEESITVKQYQVITKKIFLKPSSIELGTVEIKGSKIARTSTVNTAITTVTPKDIQIIPSIGGEPDLAQYLQTLPGVVFTGDQGGQLYIRGGGPVQNLVLLDGMIIYNPFHSIGLFSVFDTDIIKNVDVYTAGFNAEYGGRTSAVLDVRTKDGNKKETGGKISVNTFNAKANLEGPIKRSENGGSNSYILSARTSYIDRTSPVLYNYANAEGKIPFSFNDLYGKITTAGANGSKISAFGFSFNDKAQLSETSNINWNSFGFGSSFIAIPGTSSTLISGNFGYSRYDIGIKEATAPDRTSSIDGFNFGLDFTYFINKSEIKYGIHVIGNSTKFSSFVPSNRATTEFISNNTEIAAFFKYKYVVSRMIIEPSLRTHFYATLGAISLEPRLGVKYNYTDKIRFKFAGGLFSQNLIATRSDRDVVNLFNGFISSPDNLVDADGKRVNQSLQGALHLVAGTEFDLGDHVELNVEGYIKSFNPLININPDRVFPSDPDFVVETGLAQGLDFSGKLEYKNYYAFLSYSLARVDRTFGSNTYFTNFDRRHNINAVGSYKFGKNASWEFAVRWNLGSGFPFTQTQTFYQDVNFNNGIGTNVGSTNGNLGILYGDLNGGRLPYYHRLDISLDKKIKLKGKSVLEMNIGVINAYDRRNLFYFDRVNFRRVNQLPIIPSAGLSYTF